MTPKKITEHQTAAYNNVLDARNLEYLLNTRRFETAYDMATCIQKIYCGKIINDIIHIKAWIKHILKHDLSSKNVEDLRRIASRLGFTGANRIDKAGLLSIIKRESENEED